MTSKFKSNIHNKILYECSLNIEPPRRFVLLRCANGFRWKLPAEPDRLLPLATASFDAVEKITDYLAKACENDATAALRRQRLQLAATEAVLVSQAVNLPIAETKDTLFTATRSGQCILYPRWIARDWPIPSYGQTLAESFRSLSYQIEKARKTWPRDLPKLLQHLDGFWEQLVRAKRAALTSASEWTVYANPIFDDADETRPNRASTLFHSCFQSAGPADNLTPSLICTDPEEQKKLDALLDDFLNCHELQSVADDEVVTVETADGST